MQFTYATVITFFTHFVANVHVFVYYSTLERNISFKTITRNVLLKTNVNNFFEVVSHKNYYY